jgi:heme exporter protein CcmB
MKNLTFFFLKLSNFAKILHHVLFSIACLFILSFFVSKTMIRTVETDSIYAGLLFVTLLLILNLRASRIFSSESKNGILEQLILHNYTPCQIVSARFLSFYISEIIPLLILIPLTSLFFNFSSENIIFLSVILALSLPLLLSIFLLNASLLLLVNNKTILLTLISFPLIIGPTTLIALTILHYFLPQPNNFTFYLETTIYLTCIITPLALFLTSKSLAALYKNKFKE